VAIALSGFKRITFLVTDFSFVINTVALNCNRKATVMRILSLPAILFVVLVSIIHTSNAQTPCKYDWGLPQGAELRNHNRPENIKSLPGATFKVRYKTPCNCNSADNQIIALGPIGTPQGVPAFVKLKLKGYDCEGKMGIAIVQSSSQGLLPGQYYEDKTFVHFKDWLNISVLRVEVEFTLENKKYDYITDYESGLDETYIDYKPYSQLVKDKESAKNDINAVIKKYNQQYKDAFGGLAKVKDTKKYTELSKQLNANHSLFNQYDKEAQDELANNDVAALKQTFEKIRQQEDEIAKISNSITIAAKTTQASNTAQSDKSANTSIKTTVQTDATINKTGIQNEQNKTPQSTYQQQADAYLNQANNNSSSAINQAYNLNLAKMNAAAAGNNVQVQQIQQQQNQQIQQQLTDMSNQVIGLINLFSKKRPAQLSIEERFLKDDIDYVRIIDQVAESSSKPRDKYGNYIGDNDIVINNEKQNLSADEMYDNGVVENGKFHNGQKSMEWFIKAANHSSPQALVRLAELAEGNGNCVVAANLYLKAATLVDSLGEDLLRDGGLDFDNVIKAINSLTHYDQNGYFFDANFNIIDCDGYTNRKTNYLQAAYFQYKLIPFAKQTYMVPPQIALAELFLKGDSTLQKNVARAVDYYSVVINESKDPFHQILALQGLGKMFELGNGVKQNPAKAIEYFQKVITVASSNKKNYSDYIKGAEKAVKRCQKLAKDVTLSDTTNEVNISGNWKCVLSMANHPEEKPLSLTMDFQKGNNGFVTGTLTDSTPNGAVALSGFIAENRMHCFFNVNADYQLEADFIIISKNEIRGSWSIYKKVITTKPPPFKDAIDLTLTR
jgi:hypothetical protein